MLCVAVMLSVMVLGAGAAFSDQDQIENTEAVDACSALNIIGGYEDGSFHPERNIKRSEITKMICVALNGGKDPNVGTNEVPTFNDVRGTADAWAEGYIEACVAQGIVSGVGGGRFAPAGNVTGAQLAKMLLVALGYNSDNEGFTGNAWETNVNVRAAQKHLYDGLEKMDTSAAVTRDQAAQMVWNAMQAYEVEYKDGVVQDKVVGSTNDKITLLRDRYDAWFYIGTLTSVDSTNMTITMSNADKNASDPQRDSDSSDTVNFSKLKEDYSSMLGQKVKVLFKNGKTNDVIGVFALSDNTAYTVNANAVEADDQKVKFGGKSYGIENAYGNDYIDVYYTAIDGKEVSVTGEAKATAGSSKDFTSQAGVKYTATNGKYGFTAKQLFDDWDTSSAVMQFVDSDGNGRFDVVIITDYAAAEVTSVTSSKVVAGKSYTFADDNIDKDLKVDDWAVIYHDRYNDCTRVAKADVIDGTLDGLKKDSTSENKEVKYNEYQIGDNWYNGATDKDNRTDINTVKAGDKVEAVVVNGVAWMMQRASGDGTLSDVTNVAMVVNKETTIKGNEVKLQFFNDTTKVVKVDDDSTIPFNTTGGKTGLNVGSLYEYSISGEEYSFESLVTTKDYYGDFTYVGAASGYNVGDDAMGKTIDDKAKVILFQKGSTDKNNDSKVITGKQFKNLTTGDITSFVGQPVYFTADVSGLTRTAAIAATVTKLPNTTTSNDYYGYILSDAKESGTNEISYKLLLEDADEAVTVYEKNVKIADRKANTLIGYKSLDGADAEKRYIDDVHLYSLDDNNFDLGAVADVNEKGTTVQIADVNGQSLERDVTADTVVFYVDTDAKTGSSTGSIRKAVKWYADAKGAMVTSGDDKYVANGLYLEKDNEDMEVLVIESGDNQFRGPYVNETIGVSFSAEIPAIEAGASSATVNFKTKNIADGAMIKLTAKATGASAVTMTDAIVSNGAATGTLANTSALALGDYELTFTAYDSSNSELVKETATLKVGDVSIDTINAPTVAGDLKTAAPAAGKKINEILTSATAGDATMEVTGFNVKVVGKVVNDAYAIIGGDQVKVTISLKAKEGNVLASTLNVTGATLQGAAAAVENQTSTSVDLVYTYAVARSTLNTLSISGLTAPAKDAAPDVQLTAPANTKIASVEWQNDSGVKVEGNFAASTQYKVVIVLTADEGYTFGADGAYGQTVNLDAGGTVATKIVSDNGDKLTVTSNLFAQTAS